MRLLPLAAWLACFSAFGATPAPSIADYYRTYEASFARKDVAAMYAHCDPEYRFIGADGSRTSLEDSRRAMGQSLGKVKRIRVRVEPLASETLGASVRVVRYKQSHEIQLPLREPATNWFVAEDRWEKKDGQWRLVATRVATDSMTGWKARVDAQKTQPLR